MFIPLRSLAIVGIALSVISCSDSTSPSGGDNSMSAKIAGSSWSPTLAVQATNSSGVIAIAGQDNSVRQIQLRLTNVTKPGTYSIGTGTMHGATVTTSTSADDVYVVSMISGSGNIVVESLSDTKASGTFTFTGRNTKGSELSVTEGKFNVTFK